MRTHRSDSAPFFIGYCFDIDLGKLNTGVEHLPFIAEVSDQQAKKSKLYRVHDDSFGVFLRPDELVDSHDSSNIVDITKDNDVVLQTVLLSDLRVDLLHIDLII